MLRIIPIKLTAAVGGFLCSGEDMIVAVMRKVVKGGQWMRRYKINTK